MSAKKEKKSGLVWNPSLEFNHVKPSPGGWPIPQFRIPTRKLKEIIEGCDRITLVNKRRRPVFALDGIDGGMRIPHLHFKNEIILLDKIALQKYLQVAAKEVAKLDDKVNIGEFIRF